MYMYMCICVHAQTHIYVQTYRHIRIHSCTYKQPSRLKYVFGGCFHVILIDRIVLLLLLLLCCCCNDANEWTEMGSSYPLCFKIGALMNILTLWSLDRAVVELSEGLEAGDVGLLPQLLSCLEHVLPRSLFRDHSAGVRRTIYRTWAQTDLAGALQS